MTLINNQYRYLPCPDGWGGDEVVYHIRTNKDHWNDMGVLSPLFHLKRLLEDSKAINNQIIYDTKTAVIDALRDMFEGETKTPWVIKPRPNSIFVKSVMAW